MTVISATTEPELTSLEQLTLNANLSSGYLPIKRLLDVLGALTLLVVLSPVFFLVAFAIKRESTGPVFFSQQRVGKDGKAFRFFKFRSMTTDAEAVKSSLLSNNEMAGGVIFKMKNDPRVTKVGRVIRKFSIDELPQLWNVVIGDMSLVGPRPALPSEVAEYTSAQRQRLAGTPGITCTWQVSGRSLIPFEQQVAMDIEYLKTCNLILDIKLLLKTLPAVLLGKGAF